MVFLSFLRLGLENSNLKYKENVFLDLFYYSGECVENSEFQDIHAKVQVEFDKLSKFLGILVSTIQAVLPAQMNFQYLQKQ